MHTHIHKLTMASFGPFIPLAHQGEEESARPRSGGILKCLGSSVGGLRWTATAWWENMAVLMGDILEETNMGIHMA